MSAEARCTCCDLPLISCGRVAEQRQRDELLRERARLRKTAGSVLAKFGGTCVSCEEWYPAGTVIVADDRLDGWRSLECCEEA